MTIRTLYETLETPKNLQRHMRRVAAVGKLVAQNWIGDIDESSVVETLLLHDLGNLLKFDFTKGMDLFDADERDVEHWLDVQAKMITTYSSDEHTATQMMAKEAGVSERVLYLLENMGSSNLYKTTQLNDAELKVCSYADFRVSPDGFLTVEKRFQDILVRYKSRDHILADTAKTLEKMEYCLELEKQLQQRVSIDLQKLPEKNLEAMAEEMKSWKLDLEDVEVIDSLVQ